MRLAEYPFLRYLIFFILGLTCGMAWDGEIGGSYVLVLLAICYAGYLWLVLSRRALRWVSLLAYFQLFILGYWAFWVSQKTAIQAQTLGGPYLALVQDFDLSKPNSRQNTLKVLSFWEGTTWQDVSAANQNILIYHQQKDSLQPGQLVWVAEAPQALLPPKNPHEFDYRHYLLRKGIVARQFVSSKTLLRYPTSGSNSWGMWLEHLRKNLGDRIRQRIPQERTHAVALALLLGQKQELDRNVRAAFSETGVMHVLAVSGLHVGILVGVLLFLIKPFRIKGWFRNGYLLLVVGLIWGYALLTGFSPSVIRASVMFSFLVLGQMSDRKPPFFNLLGLSALLMILVDPPVLFEVGFQLSYLAVAGIILLQPLILGFWYPRHRILDYILQLTAVSIAAQLATFPLSVYYFHSFPVWFLPANLLVIPLTFLMMQLGIPLLVLGGIPYVGPGLGYGMGFLIELELKVLDWFRDLPFQQKDLSIQPETMLFVWLTLLVWAGWNFFPKKRLVYLLVLSYGMWALLGCLRHWEGQQPQLVLYRSEKSWMLDYWDGRHLKSWNHGLQAVELRFLVKSNRLKNKWGNQPAPLAALRHPEGVLYFPEVGLGYSNDSLMITRLTSQKRFDWTGTRWNERSLSGSFALDDSAIQIRF